MTSPDLPKLVDQSVTPPALSAEDLVYDAFMNLHSEYPRVIAYLRMCGATRDDADDAAQETFSEVWDQMRHKPDKWARVKYPAAWLRGTAWRIWHKPPGSRRRPAVSIDFVAELLATNADPGDHVPVDVSVMAALGGLNEQVRDDVRQVYLLKIEKFTLDEIVSYMNARGRTIKESDVRNLLSTGRNALRPLLHDKGA